MKGSKSAASAFHGAGILDTSSLLPRHPDYVVPTTSTTAAGGAGQQPPQQNVFAGVRVTRGALAIFGDDTAKQFALHVDKTMRDNAAASSTRGVSSANPPGLLVRGGDIGPRAAFLRDDAVVAFEQSMSILLNASLRQRETRQRDDDGGGDVAESSASSGMDEDEGDDA